MYFLSDIRPFVSVCYGSAAPKFVRLSTNAPSESNSYSYPKRLCIDVNLKAPWCQMLPEINPGLLGNALPMCVLRLGMHQIVSLRVFYDFIFVFYAQEICNSFKCDVLSKWSGSVCVFVYWEPQAPNNTHPYVKCRYRFRCCSRSRTTTALAH